MPVVSLKKALTLLSSPLLLKYLATVDVKDFWPISLIGGAQDYCQCHGQQIEGGATGNYFRFSKCFCEGQADLGLNTHCE